MSYFYVSSSGRVLTVAGQRLLILFEIVQASGFELFEIVPRGDKSLVQIGVSHFTSCLSLPNEGIDEIVLGTRTGERYLFQVEVNLERVEVSIDTGVKLNQHMEVAVVDMFAMVNKAGFFTVTTAGTVWSSVGKSDTWKHKTLVEGTLGDVDCACMSGDNSVFIGVCKNQVVVVDTFGKLVDRQVL